MTAVAAGLRRRGVLVTVSAALAIGALTGAMPPPAYTGQIWSPFPLPAAQSVPGSSLPVGAGAAARRAQVPLPEPGAVPKVAFRPGGTTWPAARSGTLVVSESVPVHRGPLSGWTSRVLAGWKRLRGGPVSVRDVPGSADVGAVRVDVTSHARAVRDGVPDGVMMSLAGGPGQVRVRVSYARFGGMFGGSWAWRLRLVRLPACALTEPRRPACHEATPVGSVNDAAGRYVQATVRLRGRHTVLAMVSGPTGPTGTYAATPLRPSGTWAVQQGSFTYSYPIAVPPALAGQAADVTLSYDSQSIDSETSGSNTQGGMIGDGWDFTPGFIERSYESCQQDGISNSGDLCWGGQNATLSLGAHSSPLVQGSKGIWHPQNDDGTQVQLLTGAANGLWNGEYWLVTTPDGTQYYFGADHFPGGNNSDPSNQSAWGEPVFNPGTSDPCYNATDKQASECQMGWRWNLDFVVDPQQHLIQYVYTPETNYYKMGGGQGSGTLTEYDRGGYIKQLKYGFLLPDAIAGANPAVLVNFGTSERCLDSASVCDANHDTARWPDVPWDQSCGSSGSCTNVSPTFFSTERLTSITTKVRESATYTTVDSYALTQAFPTGAGSSPVMSLTSIIRTGEDENGGGTGTIALPAVSFTTTEFDNRVDGLALTPAAPPVDRPRITSIATETGASIAVSYQSAGCSRNNNIMPAHDYSNDKPCFPVYWTPSSGQIKDWFLKYLVSELTESDQTGAASLALEWRYFYQDGAAWHYDNNPLIPASNRTWDVYRGFQQVETLTGAPGDPVGEEILTYMQGMDGDNNGLGGTKSVTVPDGVGDNVTDSNWLAGQVLEDDTYTQSGGSVVKKIVNGPWGYSQTASQSQPGGLPNLTAHMLAASQARTMQLFAGSTWDTHQVNTYYNGDAQVAAVDDDPQGSAETCTSTSYANPPAGNPQMENYPDQVTVVTGSYSTSSGSCPASSSGNIVSESRTYYDDSSPTLASLGTLGSLAYPGGLVTGTSELVSWGSPEQAQTATTYDGLGRVASVTTPTPAGASGAVTTTTTYSPAYATGQSTNLPTSILVVNPKTWHVTTLYDQGREQPLTITDPNAEQTTESYDALGRLTSVTDPADQAAGDATEKFSYSVTGTSPPAVTSQTLREDGSYGVDVKIYDGMDQLRQEQATPPNATPGRVITDTFYNSDGWAVKTRNPYYDATTAPDATLFKPNGDGAIPGWTAISYDAMGRVTASAFNSGNAQQWQTTTTYPGLNETDVTPPAGGTATSAFINDLGQTTASWQYTNVSAPDGNPAHADITSYAYTPGGQLHTVTDNAGNTWTYGYDLLGRKTTEADPGTTASANTTYDAAGNIDTYTNPDASEVSYSYDLLGRKTAEYSGTRSSGTQLDAWAYDTALLNGGPVKTLGQLSSATSFDTYGGASGGPYTEQVTGYNTAYQPSGSSTSIPASDLVPGASGTDKFTTANTYTPLTGLLSSVEYSADDGLPDETVNYSYNLEGELIASGGDTAYLDQTTYDAFGQIQRTTYGLYGQQLVQTYEQDAGTHWLTASTTNLQTYSSAADSVSYAYDQAGDLTAASDVQNVGGTQTQCFAHNDQQELSTAWTDSRGIATAAAPSVSGIGGCTTTTPSATTIGGPAPYWQSYGHDALGDRTTATIHDLSGNTANNINQTLSYPGNGIAPGTQPDAPTTITTQFGTSGSKDTTTAHYDAAGNTISQQAQTTGSNPPPAPPAESAITYNPDGQTATVTTAAGTSGYTYDALGSLLLQTDPATSTTPASTTLYLDGGAEQITYTAALGSTPADTVAARFYRGPDGTAITRSYDNNAAATSLTFQPGSTQGTATETITNTTTGSPPVTTQTLTRRYFDPYGNPVGTVQPWPNNLGFVGKPADVLTGLDLLGARQYDPVTGRFLTLDPLFQAGDPLAMGGYAYADNNPATHADPAGQCPCITDGSTERKDPNTGGYGAGSGGVTSTGTGSGTGSGDSGGSSNSQAPGTDILPPAVRAAYQNFFSGYAQVSGATGAQLELDALDGYCGQSVGGKLCGASLTHTLWSDYEITKIPMGIFMDPGLNDGGDFGSLHETALQETSQFYITELTGDQGSGASTDFQLSAACGGASFTASTKVLLASGRAVAIASLKPGEQVLATNTRTGKTSAETITAVLVHHDTNRYNLTVKTAHASAVIRTTSTHLFWDVTRHRWVEAGTLAHDDNLRSVNGATVTVMGGYVPARAGGWMWDLTIARDHDFYVVTIAAAILVHNCEVGDPYFTPERVTHVMSGHFEGGAEVDKSSGVFSRDTTKDDLYEFAGMAANFPAAEDANGNFARIVDVGRLIGQSSPMTGSSPTSFVRVIQRESGYIVTMHPW